MKRIMLALMVVVLVVPAVASAQKDEGFRDPPPGGTARATGRLNLEIIQGKIVSVGTDEVVIASGSSEQSKQVKVRIPEMNRDEFRTLLAQGIGKQGQLRCRKDKEGALVLYRIREIEGVDVSSQPGFGGDMRQRLQDRTEQLSPEQREKMRDRFGAMSEHLKENPELREELRKLAKDDPEEFRQRIREEMAKLHQQTGREGPQRDGRGAGMSGQHEPGMMGPMGMGQPGMGREDRGRFSPENDQTKKLERQTHELAGQYRQAQGQEKDELGKKLRDTLAEAFDGRAKAHIQEVKRLEEQLERLRNRLESRQKNREAIIQRRFEQLTGQEDDELAW